MPKIGILLLALVPIGCAAESRERLKMLGTANDVPSQRDSSSTRELAFVRIEVSPESRSRRVNTQQLVIATVFDRSGNPKSRAKVEWTLEGTGKIVAIDEGTLLNRGKRVDANFAYGFTSSGKRTVAGDRNGPRQEFELQAGQTWCLVTSSEPGRTSLSARVLDAGTEDNQAVATIRWTEADSRQPGSRNSTIPTESISQGSERLVVERSENSQVSLDVKLPRTIGQNRDSIAKILLANNGLKDSLPLTVRANIPETVEILRIDPPVIRRNGNSLTWAYERLAAGETQEIAIVLKPRERGPLSLTATAETADGLRAEQRLGTNVDSAEMKLRVDAPPTAATGGMLPIRVTVTNTGAIPIENAMAWIDGPDGGNQPFEKRLGTIPANESKTVTVNVPVERAGKMPIRVNVTADGGLADRAESIVQIGKSELELTLTGSETFPVGQDGLFEFRVTNRGDAPLADVTIQALLPKSLSVRTATEGGRTSDGAANWSLGTLAAGESKVARLSVVGDRISDTSTLTARADGELASGQRIRAKDASLRVAVVGMPVLTLRLEEQTVAMAVGGRTTYRATVQNRGNAPAHDVVLTATVSDELRPIRGSGPNRLDARTGQQRFTFPTIGELTAGAKATFILETEALRTGSARLAVEIKSRELEQPIKDEQAIQITAKSPQ